MDEETQRTVAIWAVIGLPFVVVGSLLYSRQQLTLDVVAFYWFPAVTLTLIGPIPPPWRPIGK